MLDILLFVLLGTGVGIVFGLVPGLHPNTIVLFVPFISQLGLPAASAIAFVVSIGVSNTFLDFIPSILLGASEDSGLGAMPGHRMLLQGNGYEAVKLAVIGALGSVIFVVALLPAIVIAVPPLYAHARALTYGLLAAIVIVMVLSEKRGKMPAAALCFFLAGAVGLAASHVPVDKTLVLFPILSGLFGVSILLFASRGKVEIRNRGKEVRVTGRLQRRSVVLGSVGGIFSGFLPGVGSAEVASLASTDRNDKSFLMILGSIALSNALLSILALWLIGNSRSGLAAALEQLTHIGAGEFMLIIAVTLLVAGISAIITLRLAKRSVGFITNNDYSLVSKAIIVMIVAMTIIFTGLYGVLLLATCTAIGIFAKACGVRRGILMGVLILPTILFYLPF